MASRYDAKKQRGNTDVALLENADIHEQICQQHNNERTSLFCRKHMVVICGRCLLQNHMKCESQLVDLNEVSHPTTDDINKLMHGLESILSDAQCLNKDVSVKRDNNNLAKEDNLKAIRDYRKQIDIYFDNLQRKAEYEITQCHVKNEDVFTEQIKTCLDVKEEAQIKLKHINNILEKKQKSTIYVTKESLGIDIAILKKTLDEASRKPMGPLYEFHKNDVVQNLISTENVLGTVEDVHTGSDEVTQTIRHEQVQLQDTFDGSARKTAPKSVTVPPIEEQKSFIRNQLERPLIKGDTWNVLDVKWFKQWKSYVGYDSRDNYYVGDECANPGPIDNSSLLEEETKTLKEHLIDDLDYTLVPSEAWTALVSWYSITDNQESLPRRVIEEGVYSRSLKVEVYRWHFKLCDYASQNDHIVKEMSRSDTIGCLKMEMIKLFNVGSDKEARLWNRYMINMYEPLNKKGDTLQDAGLYSGQVVVIEKKDKNGTWPRDNQGGSNNGASEVQPKRRLKKETYSTT